MPNAEFITHAVITGTVASIPIKKPNKTQFIFSLESVNTRPAQGLVQLAWYNHAPILHAGQHWRLTTKLKKPRNYHNPGSDNYERTLSSKHVYWTGYIQNQNNHQVYNKDSSFFWESFREAIQQQLTKIAPDTPTAGILEALTINTTSCISQDQWELFRRTGTTHLFGISGEHIALISGIFFFIIKWLWTRCERCCLRIPAPYVASIGGLLAALFYAILAGFAPPVQRALIGCLFYTLYYLGKQRFSPWQIWRYALLGVLIFEPHAVFMQGFYFSFLAVACLLLTQQRWQLKGYRAKLALQLSCLIGLMPLTLYWYSYGSLNGFIANLFAIPLVGLLIMPLALLTLICCSFPWVWMLTTPLSWLVGILYKGLTFTEQLAIINIVWPIPHLLDALALLAGLLLLIVLPAKPFRIIALLLILLPWFPEKPKIRQGEVLIRILDVGQGLAISVQTADHILLYDTGDQFYQGSDLGQMVILPYLKHIGVTHLDAIVISHPDKDHRGGLNSIESALPVTKLLVNDPDFYHRGISCHEFADWQWDGIDFHFFHNTKDFKNRNNTSCVLQISAGTHRILFTGDIEKDAEDFMVQTYGENLASDVIVLPHHGSKTSSSYRFLAEINPKHAIASLGFDNRFHFPHQKTLNTLALQNIHFYRTDECGMTEVKLTATHEVKKPACYR